MKTVSLAALLVLASSALFAQSPFDGTWALNQQKSKLVGETMTIEDAGDGAIKFVNPNFSTTVKTDGTKAQTPEGGTMAIVKKDDNTYHRTDWFKDKELSQADWKLSNGGKTLTVDEQGTMPNGQQYNNTNSFTRVSGTAGLVGKWKTTSVKMSNPVTFKMKLTGDDLVWDIPEFQGSLKAKTDGQDAHPTGPTVPESFTLAVTKQGPRTLSMTEKLQGKTIFTGTYTVSADGKTMTMDGKNAKGEPVKEIWQKQGS
jgi:hypothetical protein